MKSSTTRAIQVLGIVVLVVAVAALVFMALRHTKEPVAGAGETPGYNPAAQSEEQSQPEPEPEPEEEPAEEPEPEPEVGPATEVVATTRVLTALSGGGLVRSITGTCPQPEMYVETSWDSGANWSAENVGAIVPVTSLSRLVDTRDGGIVALGANPTNCGEASAGFSTLGSGVWSPFDVASTWRVNLNDATVLNGPGGASVSPGCEISRLSATSDGRIGVLCRDTTIRLSPDSGATWSQLGDAHAGADAMIVSANYVFMASVGIPECDGVQVATIDANFAVIGNSCVPATAGPGETALSLSPDGDLWMWAGESVVRSGDLGTTWN